MRRPVPTHPLTPPISIVRRQQGSSLVVWVYLPTVYRLGVRQSNLRLQTEPGGLGLWGAFCLLGKACFNYSIPRESIVLLVLQVHACSGRKGAIGLYARILADIKLFQLQADSVKELSAESSAIEKSLQTLLEQHLDAFLGVRLVATEYPTVSRAQWEVENGGPCDSTPPPAG